MTSAGIPSDHLRATTGARGIAAEWYRRSPYLAALAVVHLLLFVALLLLSLGDRVQVMGLARWIKPMKFALSIAIYLGSLAWFAPVLGGSRARRLAYAVIGTTMSVEIVAIVLQAARGVRSHFNSATPFDAAIFSTMGSAIGLNTIALTVVGVIAARRWLETRAPYTLGIALGTLLALLSSAIGGTMISSHGHAVGVADGGPGLPFVNWSTLGGDLRVAHFIGLHALQALPLVGWRLGARAVVWSGIAWALVTGAALAQAMGGRPLLGA